ncbi:vacuolar protein sorting-associated protein 37C [Drosophila eugracilis]|uniref:vacuolar protein sorting-associated protein 37C n=1 Tax=Drosophila eugracilis TaxID=29029 RepID=UPI001BDA7188|nr:vacuolar protein sorting-associated protein 37C [Drosophila eugracilis]XP_017081733.2 vacuolar protein sorting-associated protein 37C [Drosophila eugracilis]
MYQEYMNQLQASIAPMASDELKELLNDDEKLETKVDEVLQVLRTQKTSVFEDNRSRAEHNIEREPQIIELRARLAELSDEGRTRCTSVQDKLSQLKEKSGGVGPETALALLQTAASESEEQTEEMIKKFNDSDLGVEAFLEEFLASRRTMHLRRLKAEKMQDLMRKQRQGPPNASVPAYGNVSSGGFYPSAGNSAPYPMMGPLMPMPPSSRPY